MAGGYDRLRYEGFTSFADAEEYLGRELMLSEERAVWDNKNDVMEVIEEIEEGMNSEI